MQMVRMYHKVSPTMLSLTIWWGTNLMGPTQGPTNHGTWGGRKETCGGWKETSWMGPYIKFEINPMPLNPSSMAQKFNKSILKRRRKRFDPPSDGPIHSNRYKLNGTNVIQGVSCVQMVWMYQKVSPRPSPYNKVRNGCI